MDIINIQKIIETEINFCSLFSNEIKTEFGKTFWNTANPLSWDSNHAVITRTRMDYAPVINQIEHFYLNHRLTPRIYYSFHPEENRILSLMEKHNWTIDNLDYTFYVHSKSKAPADIDATCFFEFKTYTDDIKTIYLSDPNEGMWMVTVLNIGLARQNVSVVGLKSKGKVVGLYELHNRNGITRVDSVIIHHSHRGKGFGKHLAQHLIHYHYNHYPEDLLYLCASNPIAKHIYERYGFEKIVMPGFAWNAYKPL